LIIQRPPNLLLPNYYQSMSVKNWSPRY